MWLRQLIITWKSWDRKSCLPNDNHIVPMNLCIGFNEPFVHSPINKYPFCYALVYTYIIATRVKLPAGFSSVIVRCLTSRSLIFIDSTESYSISSNIMLRTTPNTGIAITDQSSSWTSIFRIFITCSLHLTPKINDVRDSNEWNEKGEW